MRVLVTGGSGFTGIYLTEALVAAGHTVLPFEADVRDRDAVHRAVAIERPDGVVHLAGSAFIHSDDVTDFYAVNQMGTYHLLEALAATASGIPVVLASSANVYGLAASGLVAEDNPAIPANHYAASKLAMEVGARLWSDHFKLTITRPFNYTGRGQGEQYLIAKIVAHFRHGETAIELGNLEVARDFGDVRAVAQAYVGLLERDGGGTYNICTGEMHSLHDVIAMCREITGRDMEVRSNAAFQRSNDVPLLGGNPSRLRAVLPQWQPLPLRTTLEWMLAPA